MQRAAKSIFDHRISWRIVSLMGALVLSVPAAYAAAGTASPPAPGTGTPPALGVKPPVVPEPVFSEPQSDIHGFTVIGFIKNATVSGDNCPSLPPSQWGGTVVINNLLITIPCNTTLQFPAATFSWADLFNSKKVKTTLASPAGLTLPLSADTFGRGSFAYPSTEITVEGNIVGGKYIAGLVFISQQSLNSGTGYIKGFDYANGVIFLGKSPAGPAQARLQLNDVNGRFSVGQTPDSRFNADDQNPTFHASTGYPMCVPRIDPAAGDDANCPQRNRPLTSGARGCRNFAAAGITLPTGRELGAPVAGQKYCSAFVMDDPALAGPGEPLSTQQAPFEIGDFIIYSGTLLEGDGKGPGGSDTISVHTINANLGIFTQPGTLPVYLSLGEFRVSADAARVFNGIRQEPQDRIVVEAFVTDVTSIVDVYFVDFDPVTGTELQRWLTPATMTAGLGSFTGDGTYIDGGITTQLTGPVPGRVRLRANKSTPGILLSPTRYVRVVARSLCDPVNINGVAPLIGSDGLPAVPAVAVPCLRRAPAANGLFTGQYIAPTFNFIFPENLVSGDNPVPYNLWAFNFLVNGEGPGTGRLIPVPW
jgi:hypothetical protein